MLSERGSLIVPVPRERFELKDRVEVGGLALHPKTELHLTVFNYGIGKLVKKACDADPRLRAAIDERARRFDWALRVTGPYLKLERDRLTTVVVRVDARVAEFFAEIRAQVGPGELAEALRHPGPPHVTLYTSDPEGKAGIGLNTLAALDAALERARTGETTGLRATELPGAP